MTRGQRQTAVETGVKPLEFASARAMLPDRWPFRRVPVRISVLVAVATLSLVPSSAFAGKNEASFLAKLPGVWQGDGTIAGDQTGKVTCTLTLTGKAKVKFVSQCTAEHYGQQSNQGLFTYDDTAKAYVATSKGNTILGTRVSGGVAFKFPVKNMAGTGQSTMTLTANRIVVDVTLTRKDTGEVITSHVIFAKAS